MCENATGLDIVLLPNAVSQAALPWATRTSGLWHRYVSRFFNGLRPRPPDLLTPT
ncbi:hypothetical protein GCM10009654_46340 [Streptomyces hebeiensis]|uniref:Uncharacterized protein n=1 Tax=Streptomyces hebeiensis TaxID=229486 RepID=A0ABN1V2I0_9ACTN